MKYIWPTLAMALVAGWLCVPSAHGQQQQQALADLHASNIQVDYYAPRNPAYKSRYDLLVRRQVLERLGQFLAPIKWPNTFRLIAKQCPSSGTPDPQIFYDNIEYSLIVCYQWFDFLNAAAATTQPGGRNSKFATPQEVLVGGLIGVVLHEAARATFDMLQVPLLGSDEDAADQLAGFVSLQFGPDVARTVIKGTYVIWNTYAYNITQGHQQFNFASRSSVAPQRAYSILCIAYGGDKATFKDFVDKGLLPSTRVKTCPDEYKQVARAFDKTIKPHVDQALMHKALTTTWITPDDFK